MEEHLIPDSALDELRADLTGARPPASIALAYGAPASSVIYLALFMAFAGTVRQNPVIYLDGANSFNPFLIAKFARKASLAPEEALSRIHISRAFTCHQMQALVVERLARAFRRLDADVAIISGLLDTFYDEDVPFAEAYELLRTTTAELVRLARRGARILMACPDTRLPLESRRRRFMDHLKEISHKVVKCENDGAAARLALEKPCRKSYVRLHAPELPRRHQCHWQW